MSRPTRAATPDQKHVSEIEVQLPLEFSAGRGEIGAQAGSVRPDPAGIVLATPDAPPTLALPGDPVPDRNAAVPQADGPQDPEFENVVSVRTAVERSVSPPITFKGERAPPNESAAFIFGYRSFAISDALARRQTWHIASVELTPLRRYVRLNLITEVGWEGGEAAQVDDRADLSIMQKVGLGVQYPNWLTPLAEFQAGIGAARVEIFERNDLARLHSFGVDVGAQWAVTRRIYVHASVGWLRPYFTVKTDVVYYDRATFKLGVGF
ncbi:MAG: hypothetical protein V3V08_12570 [Nannocystaceae bacterium]